MMKYFIQLLLFCAISQTTFSQNEYAISSIGYPQGLSNSAVISIYQDNLGFMWFGTYDGLNNYDGKSMQIYRTDSDLGLLNNYIQSINGANNESLWLSTNLGISRFSIKKILLLRVINRLLAIIFYALTGKEIHGS